MFIHALTGLHPGSGTALGVVDLPVQRERHTHWPVIPGSSLKGVLRDACRSGAMEPQRLATVFGPDTDKADEHAGALVVPDARLLAFPVRSLKGVFAWVTCPAVLARLDRDLRLLVNGGVTQPVKGPGIEEALCAKDSPLLTTDDKMMLEEFEFTRTGAADDVAAWIAGRAIDDAATAKALKERLVVLHDDAFGHFVRHATEVTARIRLEYGTKTVADGALFWEEFLPAETLFYVPLLAQPSRRKDEIFGAGDVLKAVREKLPPVLQIGGDETIGKGLCAVRTLEAA